MRKYCIAVAVFCFILTGITFCFALDSVQQGEKKQEQELSGKVEDGVRVVQVKASKYKYDPGLIFVKLGEKVRIVAQSLDVDHGFAISDFKVNLVVNPGKTQTVEFVADKAGAFIIYCTVYCGIGHANMRGRFIVVK